MVGFTAAALDFGSTGENVLLSCDAPMVNLLAKYATFELRVYFVAYLLGCVTSKMLRAARLM